MVTFDSANRFRFSRSLTNDAGFRPGQQVAVVSDNSRNSFRIVLASKVSKKSNAPSWIVLKGEDA